MDWLDLREHEEVRAEELVVGCNALSEQYVSWSASATVVVSAVRRPPGVVVTDWRVPLPLLGRRQVELVSEGLAYEATMDVLMDMLGDGRISLDDFVKVRRRRRAAGCVPERFFFPRRDAPSFCCLPRPAPPLLLAPATVSHQEIRPLSRKQYMARALAAEVARALQIAAGK